MTDEWNCLPRIFFEDLRKITETLTQDSHVPDKLQSEHLKNTSTERYRYTKLPAPRTNNVVPDQDSRIHSGK
jgi:hypothetical protein